MYIYIYTHTTPHTPHTRIHTYIHINIMFGIRGNENNKYKLYNQTSRDLLLSEY